MANTIVTKDQVKHVADLAQIPVTEAEEEKFAKMFTETLDYISILNELDTAKTSETYQVTGLVNIFQKDDENAATLTQEQALSNAKQTERGLIVTKAVFDRQ